MPNYIRTRTGTAFFLTVVAYERRPILCSESTIWQRRFWGHQIRDELDFERHLDYIHFNPVKHGYVSRAVDWPYSTIHRYVRNGIHPMDWGGSKAGAVDANE